jgi:sporulation protein YlmC with PRC-barrel domain
MLGMAHFFVRTATPEDRDAVSRLLRPGTDHGLASYSVYARQIGAHDMNTDTKSLIRASQILGTKLLDSSGNEFGEITEIMVDDAKGHVAFLVVQREGALTATDNFYKVGWSDLEYDRASKALSVSGRDIDDLPSAARLTELMG